MKILKKLCWEDPGLINLGTPAAARGHCSAQGSGAFSGDNPGGGTCGEGISAETCTNAGLQAFKPGGFCANGTGV